MVLSMTGFGEARLEEGGRSYHVEIRSVNNRYFKPTIQLPEEFALLESEVERVLRARLSRGSVTVRLHVRELNPQGALQIDTPVLQAYLAQLRAAAGSSPETRIDLATLLTLPGVSQPREVDEEQRAALWRVLRGLIEAALDRLVAMRAREGAELAADLRRHCERIEASLRVVRERAPLVVREYRDRLRARVEELIADSSVKLAEQDLLKEVSIYAERSDISEELNRLDGHLQQFEALLAGEESAGRKLEFVAQEMLREANTIGSKTGDAEIAREIIEVKSAIDRIKEQVQNAE